MSRGKTADCRNNSNVHQTKLFKYTHLIHMHTICLRTAIPPHFIPCQKVANY